MATTIHIGSVENLYIGGASSVEEEVLRGVDSEVLKDIGYADVPSEIEQPYLPTEEEKQAAIKPYNRRANLLKARKWAGKLRKMEGAVTTHQETEIEDIEAVENALEHYTENFNLSLAKACGHCAFHGKCSIEGKPKIWLNLHPDQTKVTRREQESLQAFEGRIDINPMAHCKPPRRAK